MKFCSLRTFRESFQLGKFNVRFTVKDDMIWEINQYLENVMSSDLCQH